MVSTTELFAGRFRLGPLLGQGGMSDVYRAVDSLSGESVALKIVRSGDPELARRLAQEVRVHQRMQHVGLIRLLDSGVANGQAYIVMELIEGATLEASLRAQPLGARLTAKLGGILGAALAHVHAEGIVHRDVKPSNILLGADGRALLGDFGIARLLDATTFTMDGTTIGTMAYMAPEQLEDHSVGSAADIWSLGIVLLECLTGRRVYEGTSSEIVARRLAGPVPLPPDLPVPWKLLLSGMLDHRPGQRLYGGQVAAMLSSPAYAVPWAPSALSAAPRGADAVPLDLRALAPGSGHYVAGAAVLPDATKVAGPPALAPTPRQQRRRRGRNGWVIALLVVALLGAGAFFAYALTSRNTPTLPPATQHGGGTTSTSTSTSTTSTTTTTVLTAPSTLGSLVSDVTSGEDDNLIPPDVGQSLTMQAQQAVSDESAGQPDQAANDLQQAASTIADAEQNGTIDSDEATTLQSDLSALAGALGLSAAGEAPSTTTTTTAPAPVAGPGNARHHHGPAAGGP